MRSKLPAGRASETDFASRACWLSSDLVPTSVIWRLFRPLAKSESRDQNSSAAIVGGISPAIRETVKLGKRAFEDDDANVPSQMPEELVKAILAARPR